MPKLSLEYRRIKYHFSQLRFPLVLVRVGLGAGVGDDDHNIGFVLEFTFKRTALKIYYMYD